MSRSNPVSWLAHQARRGVADLPRNIVWVVDTAVKSPAASAGRTLQAVGHQAASAVAEVAPFADGADSRLHRVDAALERAHELEAQAREQPKLRSSERRPPRRWKPTAASSSTRPARRQRVL